MSFKVLLHPKAARFMEKAHPSLKKRLKDSLKELEESPEDKGERLTNTPFWRLRIGDYRAIYEIDKPERKILILYIGHRKNVYDDFSRLL